MHKKTPLLARKMTDRPHRFDDEVSVAGRWPERQLAGEESKGDGGAGALKAGDFGGAAGARAPERRTATEEPRPVSQSPDRGAGDRRLPFMSNLLRIRRVG